MYPGNVVTSTQPGQWYRNGVTIPGETGNTLTIARTIDPGDMIAQNGSNVLVMGGYDFGSGTDASTTIAAVISAGGSDEFGSSAAGRSSNKWTLAEYIRDLRANGLWTGARLRILAGTNTIAGGLACGTGGTVTNVSFVSGDISLAAGWIGGGVKRLTTNWPSNAYGQDDFSVFAYLTQAVTTGDLSARRFIGNGISTAGAILVGKSSGETDGYSTRGKTAAAGAPTGTPSTGTGVAGISRTVSSGYVFRRSGADVTVTQASDGNTANVMSFFSDGGSSYADCRIGVIWFGPGTTLAQRNYLDTRTASYLAALQS